MNDKPSPEKGPEFEGYPDLATESARQDEHDSTPDLTSEEAIKILIGSGTLIFEKEEKEEDVKKEEKKVYPRYRTARDSFLDYL